MLELWEILVPTQMERDGVVKHINTRYHRVWDNQVRGITGGLTIYKPAIGQWVSPSGEIFNERMIPVRIACNREQMDTIIILTMHYYNQEAILTYKVSSEVILTYRKK